MTEDILEQPRLSFCTVPVSRDEWSHQRAGSECSLSSKFSPCAVIEEKFCGKLVK